MSSAIMASFFIAPVDAALSPSSPLPPAAPACLQAPRAHTGPRERGRRAASARALECRRGAERTHPNTRSPRVGGARRRSQGAGRAATPPRPRATAAATAELPPWYVLAVRITARGGVDAAEVPARAL